MAENIFVPQGYPTRAEREAINGHSGVCVWLTGLSASGKTSIAIEVQRLLQERGLHAHALDGDVMRSGLSADLGFTPEDRAENIRRAGAVAGLMVNAGLIVTCAFISPYAAGRAAARAAMPEGHFIECYVQCTVEVCESRDPKGLYARARAGEIQNFTGISSTYEIPESPDLVLKTHIEDNTPRACAEQVIALLESRGFLKG